MNSLVVYFLNKFLISLFHTMKQYPRCGHFLLQNWVQAGAFTNTVRYVSVTLFLRKRIQFVCPAISYIIYVLFTILDKNTNVSLLNEHNRPLHIKMWINISLALSVKGDVATVCDSTRGKCWCKKDVMEIIWWVTCAEQTFCNDRFVIKCDFTT